MEAFVLGLNQWFCGRNGLDLIIDEISLNDQRIGRIRVWSVHVIRVALRSIVFEEASRVLKGPEVDSALIGFSRSLGVLTKA